MKKNIVSVRVRACMQEAHALVGSDMERSCSGGPGLGFDPVGRK